MSAAAQFLRALAAKGGTTAAERAVAVLWWHGMEDHNAAMTAAAIVAALEGGGFPRQNVHRLRVALEADRRTSKVTGKGFRIRIAARAALDETYGPLLDVCPVKPSNAVLPMEVVKDTRGYIERVALQLNASYEQGLFDCCAVMCRRILETLIIEVYEADGRAVLLKGADGHFQMFAGLLGVLEADKTYNLGRNAVQGLKAFKALGDLSAHNRRFNARRDDIDRIRDGLRVAVEELVHLAKL